MNPSEAPYQFETGDSYSVLVLYPLINDGQWGNVSQVGTEILARLETLRTPALVVDLSPLEYMGSAQVALLVRVWKSLKKLNGRMSIQCPGQMVREVLAIAGLKSLWDIVETRDAALMSLGLRSAETGSSPSLTPPVVAITALLGAGIALGITLSGMLGMTPKNLLIIETAFIIVAVVSGALTAYMQRGFWRSVGTAVVVASIVMLAVSIVQFRPHKLENTESTTASQGGYSLPLPVGSDSKNQTGAATPDLKMGHPTEKLPPKPAAADPAGATVKPLSRTEQTKDLLPKTP